MVWKNLLFLGPIALDAKAVTVLYFQTWERKSYKRESGWVVPPADERSFSLGVLQRWRTVLPQLCCSCLNSIQDLKRKTQLRWLLTRQALAVVNNSSSLAHTVVLFTLRINKLLLWVCVSAVKREADLSASPVDSLKNTKISLNQSVCTLKTLCTCSLSEKTKKWGVNEDDLCFI